VYIIQNELTKELYIGYTKDLKRRLAQHNAHQTFSTRKNNAKYKLIYYEAFLSQVDATKREKQLKKFKSSYGQLKKRIQESLNF
jgi:putative endonuclease